MAHESHKETVIRSYSAGLPNKDFAQRPTVLHSYEQALINAYNIPPDARICTLGSGVGRETFGLYERGYRNLCGLDILPEFIETARRDAAARGWDIPFECCAADEMPYPDGSFDLITMFNNLYGLIAPHAARLQTLQAVKRKLRPGGLVFLTANSLWHKSSYGLAIQLMEFGRIFYNPRKLERGDKVVRGELARERRDGVPASWSHWFRTNEVPADAAKVGLRVVQGATARAITQNPKATMGKLRNQNVLVYVLQRPESG